MNEIDLNELVGGEFQEKFQNSFQRVVENMLDFNTPFSAKRGITIKLSFVQNEQREDMKVSIDITEKLAPENSLETSFAFGKDIRTGQIEAHEYGKQIKGQMSFSDTGKVVDTETGEIIEPDSNVINLRKQG